MQDAVRRPDIRKENPDITFGDCGKQIGKEWRAMPDDVKAPYIAKEQANRAQYNIDKANCSKITVLSIPVALAIDDLALCLWFFGGAVPEPSETTPVSADKEKGPNAPKRPLSAYLEFVRQQL